MSQKIWTAQELEQMTPAERQDLFDKSIVRDLDEVPTEFLDRIRAKVLTREAGAETSESA